uniref:Uncharacterized protein n=1 Tax=Poecilia reticulata TaxID=8081 RepID=A0A3P9NDD6_POERE
MPSSSARCAQFPRAQDKVHFYIKLRELRDQLKGIRKATEIEEVNYTFDLQLAKEDAKRLAIKEEQYDPGYEDAYGGAYVERGAEEGQANSQTNGHCTLTSTANSGNHGQWMTQSFADEIPNIGSGPNASSA